MPWVTTILPSVATGDLKALYDAIGAARHGVADVHLAQSLHPRALRAHFDLYRAVVLSSRPLSRVSRERIAVVVSAANRCRYCIAHHTEALRQLGDPHFGAVAAFSDDTPVEPWRAAEHALLSWTRRLALTPSSAQQGDVETLRASGWSDDAIVDAALTAAYFSFVNRLVLGLGVEVESDFEQTCGDGT